MENESSERAIRALVLVAGTALLALIACSPDRLVYDENGYAPYVTLLHRFGFTPQFMNSLTGSAGPLYGLVQAAFEPLTGLHPVGMRFVNVLLLMLVVAVLIACIGRRGRPDGWAVSLAVLTVPMTWVLAGLALTEMPAMVFITVSLYLQLRGLESLHHGQPVLGWFLAAAVAIGIAAWGRQPYMLLAGVPCLLALFDRRLVMSAVVSVAVVVVFVLPMVVIWRGLVPPKLQWVPSGLSPKFALVSLGYAGLAFLLLAPTPVWLPPRAMAAFMVLVAVGNAVLGLFTFFPLRSIFDHYFPAFAVMIYGSLCGSLLLGVGILFLAWAMSFIWSNRGDLQQVTIVSGLMCVTLSPLFIAQGYSSRYTGMSLPYLVLAALARRRPGSTNVVLAAAGGGFGFLSLWSYIYMANS